MATEDDIREFLRTAKIETEVTVKSDHWIISVSETRGGSEFLAYGADDLWWLRQNSFQHHRKNDRTLYYVKIDG